MPQFYAEAFKWYSLSAGAGHFEARYRLMLLYAAGRGISKDIGAASRILSELRAEDAGRLLNIIDRCISEKDALSMSFRSEFLQ